MSIVIFIYFHKVMINVETVTAIAAIIIKDAIATVILTNTSTMFLFLFNYLI
jgi:hypothetical protein